MALAPVNHDRSVEASGARRASRLHTLLVLGRISNLPTVWSNCLAAWLVSGAGEWRRFALLCFGGTLSYTGGMFLNDACDVAFDREYRPERPIIRGDIGVRTVWIIGVGLLALGWLAVVPLGRLPAMIATALAGLIVCYDLVHKRTPYAPVLMAACRFLLYLVTAAAATAGIGPALLWRAAGMAAYIIGLSYFARVESTATVVSKWPAGLLFVPILVTLFAGNVSTGWCWSLAAILAIWVVWCLRGQGLPRKLLPTGVAGLLAGIVLVDWLAVGGAGGMGAMFPGLFALALLLQRFAPAT